MRLARTHIASIVLQAIILMSSAAISAATPIPIIPDATWDGEVGTSANTPFSTVSNSSPGIYSSNASSSFGTASATLNTFSLPNPSLTASISLSTPGTNSQSHAQAFMRLDYYMSVNGPGTGFVPVDVSAFGNVSMSAVPAGGVFSNANVDFVVAGPNPSAPPLVSQVLNLNDPGFEVANPGGASNFSVAQLLSLQIGTIYWIDMYANVAAEIGGAATTQVVTAFVDPIFSIDPSFANAAGFSFQFSDGIGDSPSSATPIPAALPLFASGLGALGWLARRRKRKVALAVA